ncbi:dihydropyridine sensitive L-type calcium channel [Dictyocaulus viviparus]|uniref:Dihydropyridine sensitive L-type calcium channel n=1 Tax=Dictyocaulus viviparus TaxID=29172 RepID=A0A0D8Y342_DICVI|nr:dihydropyridine sensitive L-type calcium channel [Dictyocaulus viviparus]
MDRADLGGIAKTFMKKVKLLFKLVEVFGGGDRTDVGLIPLPIRTKHLSPRRAKEVEVWEHPNVYTVVPSTRPIVLLGPCYKTSRLTQLMHTALRSAIVKNFGSRIRRLSSDIGDKSSSKLSYDINERELRTITAMAEDLHLIFLECPNIDTPADVAQLDLAPMLFLIRISDRKILLRLLKKTGIKGANATAGSDVLNQITADQVDLIVEENGLPEATKKIFKHLEAYWLALHPKTSILEDEYLEGNELATTSSKTNQIL